MIRPAPATDLTPHWRRVQHDHGEAHAALQRVAEAIYQRTEEPVDLGDAEADLRVALELGFLESGDEGISFSDPDVRRDYLIRHTASMALPAWDDPARFADAIVDAQHRTLRYSGRREMATVVLLVLACEHGKDVVGRVGQVARVAAEGGGRNRLFWDLYNPFCEALPELDVEPRKLAETLEVVFEAIANDGTAGFVYNAVEKLSSRSREEGDALYEAFASRPTSPLITFVPAILVGLASTDLEEAHRRALDLSEATEPTARRAGIAALGLFDYSDGDHDRLLETTWERLERCRSEPDPEVDYALARAYGNLLDRKPEAAEALVDLSERQDPTVQGQIAWILFQKADEARGKVWFRRALLNLAGASTSQTGTWENLDHAAARCAEENAGFVVEFMEAMVVSRHYGAGDEEAELPKMLDGAFAELVRHHPGTLEEAVTRWFASPGRRLHRAARDVVHNTYDILDGGQPWLKLSKPVLDELEEQTVLHALQRIMGHVLTSRLLAALLLSAVRREACSPGFLGFVAGALGGYVLYNYPHEGGDYLKKRLESGEASEIETEVARAALDHSDAYLKGLHGLPLMREFQPPSQRLYLLRLAEHRQQTGMMDRAKQSSVLLNILPELPLKYGRSHFMEREGGFTEPSKLSPFSFSVEKPRGEVLDPIGQMFQRVRWQSAGLLEDQNPQDEERDEGSGA